jgi:DNA-binding CsgD family transcriptional regulator
MTAIEARVLRLVGEVSGLLELDEFCDGLFSALRAELPCTFISLNQVTPDPQLNWSVSEPPVPEQYHAAFYRFALQNPLAEWHLRTRDGRPLRFSDIVTADQLHASDLYREVYAPLGVEHQIAFTLPSPSQRILAIALSRTHEDFTDPDRDLLALARPHLIQAYRNVLQFGDQRLAADQSRSDGPGEHALRALGLTPTQARVLRAIAMGRSGVALAGELGIAPRTVHKHLQRIYAKLEVSNRSQAAARAWEASATGGDRSGRHERAGE